MEATMNDDLRRLLRLTPGILCNRCGLSFQRIPLDEWLALLKHSPLKELPQLGKWVQVRRGVYKGDVGYVLSVAASEVNLLLIPRLALRSKRKRSREPPQLKLFDHETVKQYYAIEPHRIRENIYSVGNDRFEHGLIVRLYSFDSVSRVSTIPLGSFGLFGISGHPKLISSRSSFPRPSEWYFGEGEEVYIVDDSSESFTGPSYKSGFISTLRDDAVELDTKEGIAIVSWMDICKVMRLGDFFEVTGGLHKDQKGWVDVVDLRTRVANIIRMVDKPGKTFSDRPEVCPIMNE